MYVKAPYTNGCFWQIKHLSAEELKQAQEADILAVLVFSSGTYVKIEPCSLDWREIINRHI